MPKYFYVCTNCETKQSFYHSMIETMHDCTKCNTKNSLKKIPSSFFLEDKKDSTNKVGNVVKESIEEFKEDLKIQKNDLKREYTEDDQ